MERNKDHWHLFKEHDSFPFLTETHYRQTFENKGADFQPILSKKKPKDPNEQSPQAIIKRLESENSEYKEALKWYKKQLDALLKLKDDV